MIFRSLLNTIEGMQLKFSTTWEYRYDFILDAVQEIIKTDYSDSISRIAVKNDGDKEFVECLKELKSADMNVRNSETLSDRHNELVIEGESRIMRCTLEFHFFCDTNVVELTCREKGYIRKKGKHSFDIYMDSLEINAYCRDARRRAIQKHELTEDK